MSLNYWGLLHNEGVSNSRLFPPLLTHLRNISRIINIFSLINKLNLYCLGFKHSLGDFVLKKPIFFHNMIYGSSETIHIFPIIYKADQYYWGLMHTKDDIHPNIVYIFTQPLGSIWENHHTFLIVKKLNQDCWKKRQNWCDSFRKKMKLWRDIIDKVLMPLRIFQLIDRRLLYYSG